MSSSPDPFDIRMVFFKVGWMDRYRGVTAQDTITGGGEYVREHGFGYEIFNYRPFEGQLYGWVMPGRSRSGDDFATIHLKRIDGHCSDESLSDVIVVWVATSPDGGAYVVGWYRNATVFMRPQAPPPGSEREFKGEQFSYVTTCKEFDGVLLPKDERVISVPQQGKGSFGQSNLWYADHRSNETQRVLRWTVAEAVQDYEPTKPLRLQSRTLPRQHEVLLRQRVEKAAIETVSNYYGGLGYEVRSVERDNVGWDLEATLDKRMLKLEVKGLSGSEVDVELTPNEYRQLKTHREAYRLCTATNALEAPHLKIFQFNSECDQWEANDGAVLAFTDIISARCTER